MAERHLTKCEPKVEDLLGFQRFFMDFLKDFQMIFNFLKDFLHLFNLFRAF